MLGWAWHRVGRQLRDDGFVGILYSSVRRRAGECIGIFIPSAVVSMTKRDDWRLMWDGNAISEVLRVA